MVPLWVQVVSLLGLPAMLIWAGTSWVSTRQALRTARQERQEIQDRARPHFEVNYVLLDPPGRLVFDKPQRGSVSEALTRLFGTYRVLLPGRGVEPHDFSNVDLRKLGAKACTSDPCRAAASGQRDVTAKYLYLGLRNTGIDDADAVDIEFNRSRASHREDTSFQDLFLDGPPRPFWERIGPVPAGRGLLIPLASVGVVNTSFPVGFLHRGAVREPIRLRFTDRRDPKVQTSKVRAPIDGVVLIPANEPFEGGG